MASLAAPRSLNSPLIALSQLAGVVLFGALLLQPWQATNAFVGTIFILACVVFAAAAISVVFGLDPHEVIGRTPIELLVPEDRPELEEALAQAFSGVQARVEVRVQTAAETRVVAVAANRLAAAEPPSVLLVGAR